MILVTGGTGLIGSFIIRRLILQGYEVKVLKRKTSSLELIEDILGQITLVDGDLLDLPSLNDAMEGIQHVIHCAGVISFAKKDVDMLFKVNVEGTSNLVNICLEKPVKKLIHISSVAAIGKKKGLFEVKEDAKWEHNEVSNYAKTKYLGELEVWRGASEGLNISILNPSVVLGPGDWKSGSTLLFNYIWKQKPFYINGNLNYVDVRDVADAVIKLLEGNLSNERFILNGGTISYLSFFKKIAVEFLKKAPSIEVPGWILKILTPLDGIRSFVTSAKPILTKETASIANNRTVYLNAKAKEKLGLSFKGIDETVNWVCAELDKRYNLQINNER